MVRLMLLESLMSISHNFFGGYRDELHGDTMLNVGLQGRVTKINIAHIGSQGRSAQIHFGQVGNVRGYHVKNRST